MMTEFVWVNYPCKGDWTWNIMTGNDTRATWNNEKMEAVYAYVH